jgi:Tol biopolymer transport system component
MGYMSPEQLRGEPSDARSDIFALGCVLYEMLSGQTAFLRNSTAETTAAILKEEPASLSESGTTLPAELERTFRRCLEKSPDMRFQSASDLAYNLRSITTSHAVPIVTPTTVTPTRSRRLGFLFAAAAAVLVAAVAGWLIFFFPGEPKFPPPEIIRLTGWAGVETEPALSPDGDMVAFVQYGDEGPLLQVMMIGGGEALQVARGWSPTWSPDGQEIAFYRKLGNEDEKPFGIYVIPALGGIERRVAKSLASYGLSWSPTGDLLAMVDRASRGQPAAIFLLSLETGEKQRLTEPPTGYVADFLPRFSRDGRSVAFSRKPTAADPDIFVVPVEGGMPLRLTEGNGRMWGGADWSSDGRDIIFPALRSSRTDWVSLWRLSASGGEPERLFTEGDSGEPSVSLRGNRLAYTQAVQMSWGLWRVDIALSKRENDNPINLNTATGWNAFPEYSPDGRHILFGSNRSGEEEIWVCDSDGSNPRQLTYLDNGSTRVGSWSPDGRRIVFMSDKEGNQDIYVIDSTGGVPRRLTTGETDEALPSWSRDGRSVYYCSNRSGRFEVYRMPAEGGREVQITTNGGTRSFESPDGGSLFFAKGDPFAGGHQGVWRIPTEGGEEVKVLDGVSSMLWHVADDGIYYLDSGDHSHQDKDIERPAIEFFDFATGEVSRITEVEEPTGRGFAVSPDLRWALYGRLEDEYDIMLVENFR